MTEHTKQSGPGRGICTLRLEREGLLPWLWDSRLVTGETLDALDRLGARTHGLEYHPRAVRCRGPRGEERCT